MSESSTQDELDLLKLLNYGYLVLIILSFIYDMIFLSIAEASGIIIFASIFVLIYFFPKGERWNRIVLYLLLFLCTFIGLYVIYVNLLSPDYGIPLIFRILISIVWLLNIVFYAIAFWTVRKYSME